MMIDLLEYGVQILAGRCDGARSIDGQGFNKMDAPFGKMLAGIPIAKWTDKQKRAAWRMLAKYKHQLEGAGVNYSEIPEPIVADLSSNRRIWISGSFIRIAFPYSPTLVDEVKRLPGRSWDGVNKQWLLPARPFQAQMAINFGMDHDFDIADMLREMASEYDPQTQPAASVASSERTIRVEAEKDRIAVSFDYNEIIVGEMRGIAGARFDRGELKWYAPLTADALEGVSRIGKTFGFKGDLDSLDEMAGKLRVAVEAAIEASRASSADLEVVGLGGELRPFQKAGVVYALDKKRLIIGDQMGLGKTVQALATVQAAGAYPALVMCPANLKLNWIREAQRWLPGKHLAMLGGADSFGRHDADLVVVNYDRLKQYRDLLLKRGFRAVIADESHYLKNGKAARTVYAEEVMAGVSYQRNGGKVNRRGATRMSPAPEFRILLSGSPVLNRPDELISQLRILDRLDDFGGWQHFTKTYCDAYGTRFGYSTSGAKNLKQLNDKLRATCYVRRLKEDVLKELPPKIRTVVPCEIENRKEYQKAEADLIAWLRETQGQEKANAARQAEQLVRIEALKQLAARGKMAAIKEWVEEFAESGEKLVMFAWHKEIVHELASTFKCAKITGDTPLAVRDQAVQDFQHRDDVKMLACNVQAGGVGITLTAASNVCFFELGWNPGTMDQAGDRCHRIGQQDSVTEWWFLGTKTIDEDIHQLIEKKRSVVDQATDGTEADNTFSVMNELVARLTGKGERTYDISDDWPATEEPSLFGGE